MTTNTKRSLTVRRFLGEWAILANGLVWLRGFDTEVQASVVAAQLTEAMQIREVR